MAVFVDLWPCSFTTKLSSAQFFKWGHSINGMISFPTATPSSNEPDDLQGEDVYEDFESKDMIA